MSQQQVNVHSQALRACKAARDEAAKKARETRRRNGERRDWDDWKHEDSAPPQASMAHILSGSCAGNKVAARNFMRELDKHAARATARVERTAPDSKDTATFLRRARAASLKAIGSKFWPSRTFLKIFFKISHPAEEREISGNIPCLGTGGLDPSGDPWHPSGRDPRRDQ